MFGKNKILKPENSDGKVLKVQEIFATFQGEGPFAGWPAVFIRLGGCNLACKFCDTEFDSFAEKNVNDIVNYSLQLAKDENGKIIRKLAVITGGEPLRQNISLLCRELINNGFVVQIETNGTLFRELPEGVKIICSPKNQGQGYHKIRQDLLRRIDAIKFIISAQIKDYQDIADVGQNEFNIPVYLQPMDEYDEEKNHANVAHTLFLAEKYGARISLQMHKILGIA